MRSVTATLLAGLAFFGISSGGVASPYEYRIITKKNPPSPSQQPLPVPAISPAVRPIAPSSETQPQPSATLPAAESANPNSSEEPEAPSELHIMCVGAGSANKLDSKSSYSSFSGTASSLDGGHASFSGSGHTTSYEIRSQDFEDQVSLELSGPVGRLRMPRTMLPIIRGGQGGWFKLKDIQYKANEITASIAVNVLNNPKLRLDRYSGAISISGKAGDYAGRCKKFDPAKTKREF